MPPPNEPEVQSIVEFFTRDSDATRCCGLGVGATIADVERRFGKAEGTPLEARTSIAGHEVWLTDYHQRSQLTLGATPYTCLVQVMLSPGAATGFPFVDVRLVREGYVMGELRAAAKALKAHFAALHGPKLRFERGGLKGELWIEANGSKETNTALGLTPRASLRVRSSPLR